MKTCIYLRKSRADEELEKLGHGNTLNRHRDSLLKKAHEMKLDIISIHEELVSGESINGRPEMIKLLSEVSDNKYDAVLVMDMDRLGRGNMQEQGLILDTFKQSNTKIITEKKVYDLNNEFDEEYSEFEAFMARKELKLITKRMQRGRLKSIEEGNYISTYPPFGYYIEGTGRNRNLIADPDTAPIIKLIFEMYSSGKGGGKIATHLNSMGYKTARGKNFASHSIINIIKNSVYIGKLTWKKKEYKKGTMNNRCTVKLRSKEDWIVVDGRHEPLIDEKLFNTCQYQLQHKTHEPYNKNTLTNPLAGIVFCSACDKPMTYRPYSKVKPHLICHNHLCTATKSSRFDYVEEEILKQLNDMVKAYSIEIPTINNDNTDLLQNASTNIKCEITKLQTQKASLHDLLEQGIYDIDTFLERSEVVSNKLIILSDKLKELNTPKSISKKELALQIRTIIDAYTQSDNADLKNQMLKTLIEKITYSKDKSSSPKDFTLTINLNF